MTFSPVEIDLSGVTRGAPLRVAVPLARGVSREPRRLAVQVEGSSDPPVQARVTKRWPDGSTKWCQLDWVHAADARGKVRIVDLQTDERSEHGTLDPSKRVLPFSRLSTSGTDNDCRQAGGDALVGVRWSDTTRELTVTSRIVDSDGVEYFGACSEPSSTESGPVYSRFRFSIDHHSVEQAPFMLGTWCDAEWYPAFSTVRFRVTVRNPRPADHPGGNWDLGNGGSVFLKDWSIEFTLPDSFEDAAVTAACEPEVTHSATRSMKLFQASSGGENWRSSNHIDKDREIPLAFRGYQLDLDGERHDGLRATPQVVLSGESATFAVAMRRFWENFPKAIEVSGRTVRVALFPREAGYPHELQGGEQKTYEFAVYFGDRTEHPPLDWYLHPAQPRLDPEYYASTGAIPYLTPRRDDPNEKHHALVDSAIDGEDSFFAKREKIDEYGWRNYGDIYGDHEAVYHDGPTPLISHYNNQYDCTGAFAWQFFRTGDVRWFDQMVAMADHVWDIDTYHTTRDKLLYNGGLFWHTYHYADADTGTHRSYPRKLTEARLMKGGKDLGELGSTGKKLAKNYAIGGGPSASQNYSTGWMWAYFLTGQEDYRDAAINAADYVIAIEDGRKTIFRWLSRGETGYATESSAGYHGPGRASANSLHALLTGYELTRESTYLDFAEKLIRRVSHPQDDLESLDLLNAELRWFYTMYFQALTRFIDVKREHGQDDEGHALAIATLNHYAGWMAEHERPTLDQADRLQYPTETWVAQDMRKWHVLEYAAWLNRGDAELSKRLQEKADFFYDYVCETLSGMPTRTLCRPVVLMMQFGWQRNWFRQAEGEPVRLPEPPASGFAPKPAFTPQREIAIRRAKRLVVAAMVGAVVALGLVVWGLVGGW